MPVDADLDLVADSAVNAGFGSAGERCMAISVVVAVEPVADALIAARDDLFRRKPGVVALPIRLHLYRQPSYRHATAAMLERMDARDGGFVSSLLDYGDDRAGSGVAVHDCGDLERAVSAARRAAQPGDTVLLSPAYKSFDQYRDYEARGEHFRTLASAAASADR